MLFLRLGCPPGPVSCGLGWLPVSRLGFALPGLISVCGLLLFGGSLFLVARPVSSPARQGLTPLGFFLFLLFLVFCVTLSWLCAHSAAPSVWMFRS